MSVITKTMVGLTLWIAACGASPAAEVPVSQDAALGVDTGDGSDAGEARRDAEATPDAGLLRDGGEADAGSVADAGVSPGPSRREWFANYNSGESLDYLDAPHSITPGDRRYPNAARHTYHADIAYGPHPRNRLDVWSLDGAAAAPVVVFMHGGGFVAGSKQQVHLPRTTIPRLLAAGMSVVSIDYRYGYQDPDAAVLATNPDDVGSVPDVDGARLDYILRDCARAIQFLRYRAVELDLDPTRIGVYGNSAGAGCATWIGAVEDLAEPMHRDPVLRESTRIQAVGHTNGQCTYAYERWPDLLNMEPDFVYSQAESVRLTQMSLEELFDTAEGEALQAVMDYYEALGPGDPPFYTENENPDLDQAEITSASQVIHHPRGHVALYERCIAAGLDCTLRTLERSEGADDDVASFMARVLRP